jgi:hypothetical protein
MSLCIAGTSVSAGLSVPCVVRCTIHSTYAAARMMPTVAMTAYTLCTVNVPISTRNSLTKGAVPGSASEARPAKKRTPASTGTSLPAPPKSLTSAEPRRATNMPTTRNSRPVARPWLTMYSTAPVPAWVVKAKMPMPMKPKWAIDVYDTSRFRSCWPTASRAA